MADRFNADDGSGVRSNTADFSATASADQRGGNGSETEGPKSSSGFRRALMKSQRQGSKLKDVVSGKDFGSGASKGQGKTFRKPNYFAQGSQRHGMHIGSGAPPVTPANQEGAEV